MSNEVQTPVAPQEAASIVEDVPQTDSTHATPNEGEIVTPPNDEWASRFERLSAHENSLRKKELTIKEQIANIEAYNKLQEQVKSNPLEALNTLGLSWEDLVTKQVETLQQDTRTPEQKRLEELERELSSFKSEAQKREEEALKQEHNAQMQQVLSSYQSFAEEAKDAYPFLGATPEVGQAMFETANAIYQETGIAPSNKEVAETLNEALKEQLAPYMGLLGGSPNEAPAKQESSSVSPTLTNAKSFATGEASKEASENLTRDQRRARALGLI